MHLRRFSLYLALLISTLSSKELERSILSSNRLELFDYREQKVIQESKKLSIDWISPITYSYNYYDYKDLDNQDRFSAISINQAIFKSGGIYNSIKYASNLQRSSIADIDIARKNLIKEALSTLFEIYKTDSLIEKQLLLIKNGELDVFRKKEQVLSGLLDASYLDNALLELSAKRVALSDIKYSKEALINRFESLSEADYKAIELPKLELIDKMEFLKENKNIQKQEFIAQKEYRYKNVVISRYLPSVNAIYNYTKYHGDHRANLGSNFNNELQKYGLNLTIPLDFRAFSDTQSAKIEYLKSQTELNIIKDEENSFYKTKLASIKRAQEKLQIAKEELDTYSSLVSQMSELSLAGYKTDLDLQTMQNSKSIKELDLDIYEYELQIELLELYARI